MSDERRRVPRTDVVLADARLVEATSRMGRAVVKAAVTQAQQRVREGALDAADLVGAVLVALPTRATTLRPVLNATGVVLHTNLGRAPLSAAAVAAMATASAYVDVEYDVVTGQRAPRGPGGAAGPARGGS